MWIILFNVYVSWLSDPQLGPCPTGYTQVDGHVDPVKSEIRHANRTFEECKEWCENDAKCVSFEFCHYLCDPKYGFPYKNQCIINYKNFPRGDTPVNFFQCSKGKHDFLSVYNKLQNRLILYQYFIKFGPPIYSYL